MKKFLIGIVLSICVSCMSFAQSFNIDAGVAMNYSDGYDGVVFGGTVDFDYVLPTNVVIFSNTDFAFGSDLPKVAISEILGAGYRFTISEKFYFQVGGGLGFVFFDHGDDSNSDSYYDPYSASLYCEVGPALAAKFGVKFTDLIGMNFGFDAIYNPVKIWSDKDSIDPESHLSIIPKVCFVLSF